jgi:hypothetical protein
MYAKRAKSWARLGTKGDAQRGGLQARRRERREAHTLIVHGDSNCPILSFAAGFSLFKSDLALYESAIFNIAKASGGPPGFRMENLGRHGVFALPDEAARAGAVPESGDGRDEGA